LESMDRWVHCGFTGLSSELTGFNGCTGFTGFIGFTVCIGFTGCTGFLGFNGFIGCTEFNVSLGSRVIKKTR
jgi:hypothetical protein